ncbi:MAG: hypothetical protein RBJ76_15540 [Stenomitos frigidus ULC029]
MTTVIADRSGEIQTSRDFSVCSTKRLIAAMSASGSTGFEMCI